MPSVKLPAPVTGPACHALGHALLARARTALQMSHDRTMATHCSFHHNVGHVVDEGAQHKQNAILRQDAERLIAGGADLEMRLEGPLGRLMPQPFAAGLHVDLRLAAHKKHLHMQPSPWPAGPHICAQIRSAINATWLSVCVCSSNAWQVNAGNGPEQLAGSACGCRLGRCDVFAGHTSNLLGSAICIRDTALTNSLMPLRSSSREKNARRHTAFSLPKACKGTGINTPQSDSGSPVHWRVKRLILVMVGDCLILDLQERHRIWHANAHQQAARYCHDIRPALAS